MRYLDCKHSNLSLQKFTECVIRDGWTGGCEDLLYASLDVARQHNLNAQNFHWFEVEKQRWHVKEQARRRFQNERVRRSMDMQTSDALLLDFKQLLKKKYGNFFRAWRCALSHDDAMTLHKPQFLKACTMIDWAGDARLLWRALDRDDSGSITIDEFDPHGAQIFASFQRFILRRFGTVLAAFRAIDMDGTKTLKQDEFVEAMRTFGFEDAAHAKLIFHGLDKDRSERLCCRSSWRSLTMRRPQS